MALRDLLQNGAIYDFVLGHLDPRAFGSDCWTFLHIPKTAGSSFREELANVIQPDYNIEVDYNNLDPANANASFEEKMRWAIEGYSRHPHRSKVKFVSGHFRYRDIKNVQGFEGTRMISMLRHPLKRLLSDYRYQISHEHPLRDAVLARYPTFRDFYLDPINKEVMFFFLCDDELQSAEDCLRSICDSFTFVGIQERYTFSLRMIFMMLGMRIEPRLELRKTDPSTGLVVPVSSADIAAIEENNPKDYFLWNSLRDKYHELEPEFYKYSDFDRFFKMANGLPFTPLP